MQTHYLIIGSGIAGLSVAVKLAEQFVDRKIVIVSKDKGEESNTNYAQGGIAVVIDRVKDNFEQHIKDTLTCGDGLCDKKVVESVVKNAPNQLQELISWGAQFDREENGTFDLAKEGGHSTNRVVHHKDETGKEIERAVLLEARLKKNIIFLEHHFAVDLMVKNNICLGASILNKKNKQQFVINAGFTILATGGVGQIYQTTTNSTVATGDGIAMAIRAKAKVCDMEFIQFHPTAFFSKSKPTFLISEAVRGFGAFLKNKNGYRFMFDYDSRGELASRDIVSRSIINEMYKTNAECVFLDATHLDKHSFQKHFPAIYKYCLQQGIDVFRNYIPVVPTQHYICGGITVDTNGQTSVLNLFACGECAHTGLHGANRLASNSLLEAVVYAQFIFNYLKEKELPDEHYTNVRFKVDRPKISETIMKINTADLNAMVQNNVGIVRNQKQLQNTLLQLKFWRNECNELLQRYQPTADFMEFYNKVIVAHEIVTASIKRTNNKGCFYKA